jgi:alpha-L-rhamnosidase
MLDGLGATIVTEAWDPSLKSNMTFSHAWGSAPANVIPRQILGVKVTAPGAATLEIRPRPGRLAAVQGRVPTIRGAVEVSLDRASGYSLEVDVPANTTAFITVELGTTTPESYTISGDHPDAPRQTTTDQTGPLLTIGPVGSGRTKITSPQP